MSAEHEQPIEDASKSTSVDTRIRESSVASESSTPTHESASEPPSAAASSSEEGATGSDEGEGDGTSAEASDATPGEGPKKRRRRRRRKKAGEGATEGAEVDGSASAEAGTTVAGTPSAKEKERKDSNLPFHRFFEGRDRGERRHAFAVGEVVAGRVVRVEHGASVIDLFGKAIGFARANEPREVPLPTPEEPEELATEPSAQGVTADASDADVRDPSLVGGAAAGIEGTVGMPGAEALPETPETAPETGAEVERVRLARSEHPEVDEAPSVVETDPLRVGGAAHALKQVGTPELGAPDSITPPPGDDTGGMEGELAETRSGDLEAPAEELSLEAEDTSSPDLDPGSIFRGRVAAVAESGHVALYNRLVTRTEVRAKLAKAREDHRRVWGLVYGFNRGGFDVLIEGVRAFCPVGGLVLEHIDDPEAHLGHRLEFSVQQAKSGHQGIVVSRRSILERESRKRAKELRRSLQPGQRLTGRVTQVRDFGMFVDLGGVEGLVHMSEVSWDRTVRPSDVAKPGDTVDVQVLRITEPQNRKDRDGRIGLSIKALADDPWEKSLEGVEEGSVRKGRITRTTDFGAFVELASGVEGLLHISELGHDLKHANERVKEGDELAVVLERIDKKARRISLSKLSERDAKAFEEGTFEAGTGGKAVRPGAMLKVKVERVEPVGLHVQVEGVIGRRGRGFIPNAEMGTERGTDHRKRFPPGTEIDVKVIGTDRDGGLRMSRKAFHQDEERRAVHDYRKEAATKGFGTFGDLLKNKLKR